MWRENIEVVRGVYEEISDRLDVSPEHFDPEFVMDMHEIADIGMHRGLPAAREIFRQYATTFDDFRVDPYSARKADRRDEGIGQISIMQGPARMPP